MNVYVGYMFNDDKIMAVTRDLESMRKVVEDGWLGNGYTLESVGTRWYIEKRGKMRGFVELWEV